MLVTQCLSAFKMKTMPNAVQNVKTPRVALPRTSLVVQWLRLCACNTEDPGSIPGLRTRSHMPWRRICMLQLRPRAAQCIKQTFFKKKSSAQGIDRHLPPVSTPLFIPQLSEYLLSTYYVSGIVIWCKWAKAVLPSVPCDFHGRLLSSDFQKTQDGSSPKWGHINFSLWSPGGSELHVVLVRASKLSEEKGAGGNQGVG